MPLLCQGACKWSLLGQADSGCTSPLLPWREGVWGFEWNTSSNHRHAAAPLLSLSRWDMEGAPFWGRQCPRQKSCWNRGALCAWLLALSISPPGCQLWPCIVTLCSQQSFVPAEAHLGALWAFGCNDSKWLNPALLPSLLDDTDDEVAQYLDHLLQRTTPQSNLPPTTQRGGLSRFRAAVHTTRDLMSLASKAKDLHVQSE